MSATPARARPLLTWLRRAAGVLALVVVAYLGGVATTQLWPVETSTRFFSAEVSVEPTLDRTVRIPTVVGDVLIDFGGPLPAPGLSAQVQVRDEVTSLLRRGELDPTALQPDSDELRGAIDAGVREVAWKFAAGALTTTLLSTLAYAVTRRRRAWTPLVSAGLASFLALALPGLSAWLTYRTDNVHAFRTTSLLSAAQSSGDILEGLDERAGQGAVYVTNLLALSDAMREEFNPGTDQTPPALTVLLVSDVHGMNQYPLMRQIVESQEVDLVVDTGDLVNFGRAEEGEVTRLYQGIESLGVPYLFVRGNHDATSTTDEGLLRRLEQVPKVVLLEPTAGTHQKVSAHGVTFSGFNDVRYYADSSTDKAGDQEALAQRWRETTGALEPTDVVVAHEPFAANRIEPGQLTLAGHMHVPALSRGHLQLGSFTGGGLVNQFSLPPLTDRAKEAEQGAEDPATAGELEGHASSFDVLRFDQDCSVRSLTRYTYRDLVSGRPQFEDVSLVNGSSVRHAAPEEGRTCGPELGVSVEPLLP